MNFFFTDILKELKKNKLAFLGLIIIFTFIIIALLAPIIAPHNPSSVFPNSLTIAPFIDGQFLLGTDDLGRDILSRLIYGSRISLMVGTFCVLMSLSFGLLTGLTAGYFGGKVDSILMRFIDILMSLPSILLAIFVVAILGPGLFNAIVAVGIVSIPSFARIVRASTMIEKEKSYVKASMTFQSSSVRIMFNEILPNCLGPIIVQASFAFSEGILSTAALGFLGLGAQAPMPEWGIMLSDARSYLLTAPWLLTLPGLCILTMVISFNILGDGLRDIFDPKTKRRK